MESAVNKQLGFDPSTVKRLTVLEILKRIGPGIILAGVVVGPGAITTAAMLMPYRFAFHQRFRSRTEYKQYEIQ